jgi:hypothetical protein
LRHGLRDLTGKSSSTPALAQRIDWRESDPLRHRSGELTSKVEEKAVSNQTVKNGNTRDYALAGSMATLLTLIAAFCTHATVESARNSLVALAFFSLAVVGTAVFFARLGVQIGRQSAHWLAVAPLDSLPTAPSVVDSKGTDSRVVNPNAGVPRAIDHYIDVTRSDLPGTSEPVERQLMAAGRELARLHEILAHAIDQLIQRFERIAASVQAQRELVEGPQPGSGAQRVSELGRALDEDIHGALTALQFQDLSAQLIQHVQDRLEAARDELARPGTGARIPDYGAVAANESLVHRVGPVAQTTVSAGSVDLF